MARPRGARAHPTPTPADGQSGAASPLDALITGGEAANVLLLSVARFGDLVREGHIPREAKGQYRLREVVHGYLRFRNDTDRRANKTAADSRVRDARAEEIQLRIGLRSGQLMEHADHVAIVEEFCALVRAEVGGLPARLTRDLTERRRIEAEVYDLFIRLAARAEAMARVGPTRREALATDTDNPAGPMGGSESDVPEERGATGSA
jgi:hypothetical protein